MIISSKNKAVQRREKRSNIAAMVAGFLAMALAGVSQATVIASQDFTGRTVSGVTASNLTWVVSGIADPGSSLSADYNLFDTSDAQNRFAVDRNLHNEGTWMTTFTLAVLGGNNIAMGAVDLNAFIFNNDGALQGVQRNLDLSFLLSGPSVSDTKSVTNIYANSGTAVQPQAVSFDFTGNTLLAGNTYTLKLTASGSGPGNNAGFDDLVVNGDLRQVNEVPEPATPALLALGLLGAGWWRRRRAAA